jgi:transcription factor TFIIIB component B''
MTGKDFSGPVPEIRAPQRPQPAVSAEDGRIEDGQDATPSEGSSRQVRKRTRSRSQMMSDADAIVIGDADGLVQAS